jgi:hypothetical protein
MVPRERSGLAAEVLRSGVVKKFVNIVLVALVLLDVAYAVIIFSSPQKWFDVIHGVDYVDPQALLKRTAAGWTAFAVFQAIALVRWQRAPHWLMLVAGIRFTESFTDWVYFFASNNHTWLGRIGLLAASPINVGLGIFFYRAYFRFTPAPPDRYGARP